MKIYNFIMKPKFAEKLKTLRKEKGLKQCELARKLNVTQRKISYWETEQLEPDLETLINIANYFEVTVDYLLGLCD